MRFYITAPLTVFSEGLPTIKGTGDLKKYLLKQAEREKKAIPTFIKRARRDPELHCILHFYALDQDENKFREVISLLNQSCLDARDGFAVPFILEFCAHFVSTAHRSELDEETKILIQILIKKTYNSPRFIDEEQRQRFIRIFGEEMVI